MSDVATTSAADLEAAGPSPSRPARRGLYRRFGKRLFDLAVAVPALVVLAPVVLVVAVLVRVLMGSPVLFRQCRPGRAGRPFELVKFRTMRPAEAGSPAGDADRLTPLGRLLRSSSLDELPSLVNVVRGDMSLVGPRPLLMRYLGRYSPEQARRHEVRPGVTGWAQVNGRNAVGWEDRFRLDVWYVDHVGFLLDVRIVLLTVIRVLRREGVAAAGHATMPEFEGRAAMDGAPDREKGGESS